MRTTHGVHHAVTGWLSPSSYRYVVVIGSQSCV